MRNKLLIGVATAGLGATLVLPATAADAMTTVHLVHGVPDTPVDVCVDGTLAADDFAPGTRDAEGVDLTTGDHDVKILADDAADCDDPALFEATVAVGPEEGDIDLVAHLDDAGDLAVTAFENDLGAARMGNGFVTVRHAGDVGTLDVMVDDESHADDLMLGDSATAAYVAGPHTLTITPDSETDPLIAAEEFTLAAGTHEYRYIVGSVEGANAQTYAFATEVGEVTVTGDRLEGDDREGTAVAISQEVYPDGAPVVYIARRDLFPDALAAKSLQDGPILFAASCGYSDGTLLRQSTADEIERLQPERVVALGGEAAICDDVLDAAVTAAS